MICPSDGSSCSCDINSALTCPPKKDRYLIVFNPKGIPECSLPDCSTKSNPVHDVRGPKNETVARCCPNCISYWRRLSPSQAARDRYSFTERPPVMNAPSPVGYMVMTKNLPDSEWEEGWQPDWDGELHRDYDKAVSQLAEARKTWEARLAVLSFLDV